MGKIPRQKVLIRLTTPWSFRQVSLLAGEHLFIRLPGKNGHYAWLLWLDGLKHGLWIGMSEAAWVNQVENSHGIELCYLQV